MGKKFWADMTILEGVILLQNTHYLICDKKGYIHFGDKTPPSSKK